MTRNATPRAFALTIAGSDSGGGAGIQADLRSFASQGVYGLTAITAVTAQNSGAVERVLALKPVMVQAQIDAVARDFPITAVKTGMLANTAIIRTVARASQQLEVPWIVDPVMIATSGASLLDPTAEQALRSLLLPRASVLTPNIPEAETLLGERIHRSAQMERAAEKLRALGPQAVLLKGGHLSGREVIDVYCDASGVTLFRAPRQKLKGHGTGCTLASLLAARHALGERGAEAATQAIAAFRQALVDGAEVGESRVYVAYPIGRSLVRLSPVD